MINLHLTTPVYAQDFVGTLQPPSSKINDLSNIGAFASTLISLLVVGAGLYALVQFLLGGFNYITSGGDAKKAGEARQRIYYSVIGLAIVAGSFVIIRLISQLLFGTDIITNPTIKTL
jgi:hypothetical protein